MEQQLLVKAKVFKFRTDVDVDHLSEEEPLGLEHQRTKGFRMLTSVEAARQGPLTWKHQASLGNKETMTSRDESPASLMSGRCQTAMANVKSRP